MSSSSSKTRARRTGNDDVLEAVSSATEDDYFDPGFSRRVYDAMRRRASERSDDCPPLSIVIHAVRDILWPSFVPQQTLDLLVLLVHLEAIRNHLISTTRLILDPSHRLSRLLSPSSRERLQLLSTPTRLDAQRKVYRQVIHASCLLHIHHLWRQYDPVNDRPLTDYLIAYFPAFLPKDDEFSDTYRHSIDTHPWHHGLSDTELAENCLVGKQAAEFMAAATEYLEDPARYCTDRGFDVNAPFDELFPPPDAEQVSKAVMRFVKMVKTFADALEALVH